MCCYPSGNEHVPESRNQPALLCQRPCLLPGTAWEIPAAHSSSCLKYFCEASSQVVFFWKVNCIVDTILVSPQMIFFHCVLLTPVMFGTVTSLECFLVNNSISSETFESHTSQPLFSRCLSVKSLLSAYCSQWKEGTGFTLPKAVGEVVYHIPQTQEWRSWYSLLIWKSQRNGWKMPKLEQVWMEWQGQSVNMYCCI